MRFVKKSILKLSVVIAMIMGVRKIDRSGETAKDIIKRHFSPANNADTEQWKGTLGNGNAAISVDALPILTRILREISELNCISEEAAARILLLVLEAAALGNAGTAMIASGAASMQKPESGTGSPV